MMEHQYRLSARVRPLALFWIQRDNVGEGRIRWTQDASGGSGVELLIGSDPDRVPMRINRWGYIGEFRRPGEAEVIGVMTETKEKSVEDAKRKLDNRGNGHAYRALRTRIRDGASVTELIGLSFADTVTYRAVDTVRREVMTREGRVQRVAVPEEADHGFLTAVESLVDTSVALHRAGTPPGRLKRVCIYANTLYEVRVESTRAAAPDMLESQFAVLNRATGKTSRFRMMYGAGAAMAGVPVRIVFRPNWWFEAELNLDTGR